MNTQTLVSVIIPVYNRAELVVQAIQSVLNQSYKALEILIINDASTDDTESAVNAFKDDRVHYIRHQTHMGGAAARNTGIEAASGEFIAFLDSDDEWFPEKVNVQLTALQQQAGFENILSYTRFENYMFDKTRILPFRGKLEHEALTDYVFADGGAMQTSTLMLSCRLAQNTRFRPQLRKHQDLDFVLRLAERGAQFYFLPQTLTIRPNNLRPDRITFIPDYQCSLNWLREYRGGMMSRRAIVGFLLRDVVPKLLTCRTRRIYAATLIVEARVRRLISPERFQLLVKRLFLSLFR